MAAPELQKTTGAAAAGGELRRFIDITEGVKHTADIAARVSRIGVNAIIMARRAGNLARGFGVLSTELRSYTITVTRLMDDLSTTAFRLVRDASALLQQSRNLRLLQRACDELGRRAGPPVLDAALEGQSAARHELLASVQKLRRELSELLDGARQLGSFGTVLARNARIEVTYAGAHSAELGEVAQQLDCAIAQIVEALEQVRRANPDNQLH